MRSGFAHDAVLTMTEGGDERAPGGAITVALCGSSSHDGPCPLAPHHTQAERSGDEISVRVLFAAAREQEAQVRAIVDEALAGGTTWRLVSSSPSEVRPEEAEHVGRLIRS